MENMDITLKDVVRYLISREDETDERIQKEMVRLEAEGCRLVNSRQLDADGGWEIFDERTGATLVRSSSSGFDGFDNAWQDNWVSIDGIYFRDWNENCTQASLEGVPDRLMSALTDALSESDYKDLRDWVGC